MVEPSDYMFSLYRIFIGDFGPLIYIEIIIRVIIIMTYTTLMIKWIGKRAVGSLGSTDVLLVIAMGSCVGDAMLYPSIPLLVSIVVITTIASIKKFYVYLAIKHESIRKKTHPTVVKIVENGKLLEVNFTEDQIDKNEVLMLLRQSGIRYLSEVDHAYYEPSGNISVFRNENSDNQFSILPEHVNEIEVET